MKTRTIVLALGALLLAFVAGCGVDATDKAAAPTETTAKADTTATTDGADDETTTTDASDDGDETTTTEASDDGDETTTTEGSDDGGDVIPGFSREELVTQLEASGLTEDQAGCVADALIDAGLTDVGDPTSFDPSSEKYQEYISAVQACVIGG